MTPNPKNSAFGFEAAEESPGFMLWQTTVIWQRHIKKALEPYNITHAQFVVMAVVLWFEEHYEEPTQTPITQLSKLDKMVVSKVLKELGNRGYIHRVESEKDSRAKCVGLTSSGKKLITRLVPIVERVDAEFFNALNVRGQKTIVKLLNQIMQKASE